MRLEMASYAVRDVRFAHRTEFRDGILSVDREELRELLLASGDFADVAIEVARPGEAVRIIHVMDAAEPRYKPEPGSTFPGFVGRQKTVGEGRTQRLAGLAILSVSEPVVGEPTYWREAIVDMAGPGVQATAFGSTVNLVLEFKPRPEDLQGDQPEAVMHDLTIGSAIAQRYNRNVRVAELKAAAYLARMTVGLEPDRLQVYALSPTEPSLPKVVYFFQVGRMQIYGKSVDGILPSLIHPNEILDGALVNVGSNNHASQRYPTYLLQNHAIVRELYAHHGTALSFAGVIVYPMPIVEQADKELVAEYAVKLARMLGAQGACSSYWGGGHPCVELMLIAQKCERAGVRTVQIMPESYGTPEDPGFVHSVPEAVAIVSTGRTTQRIAVPAMEQVIGGQAFFDLPGSPGASLNIPYRYFYGSCASIGAGRLAARQY